MNLATIRHVLRSAFAPTHAAETDDLRRAIRAKQEAGDRLMLVATSIAERLDGHADTHRSVVEATRRAGDFQ